MTMLRKILGFLTFSCMRITEMVESKEAANLSFWDSIRYKTHMIFCMACSSYERQSGVISEALSRLMTSTTKNLKSMDEETKQKILEKIKKNKN